MKHEPDHIERGTLLSLHNLIMKYNDENCNKFVMIISQKFNYANIIKNYKKRY